jgi:CheY-like chemotaxis protein
MSNPNRSPHPPHARHGAVRVLVVDDSEIVRHLAARILAKLGCAVAFAEDGEGGLRMLASETFDLVFMDCQMPGADGRNVTRAYRERERLAGHERRIPIVALTGSTRPEERG